MKGVIRSIRLTENAQMIYANIVVDRNPRALAAKRIASTTSVIIAFDGPRVPRLGHFGATLIPCSLYRKQIDICYQCGRSGIAWTYARTRTTKSAEAVEFGTQTVNTNVLPSVLCAGAPTSPRTLGATCGASEFYPAERPPSQGIQEALQISLPLPPWSWPIQVKIPIDTRRPADYRQGSGRDGETVQSSMRTIRLVKSSLLKSYSLSPGAFRRRFRKATMLKDESYVEFGYNLKLNIVE
ncbi:hypothetical protein HPB52_019254 [Rhipicephalus sanguineus]|uniref:Uncharacterized protein n=1 Tax=Rhipicephalus sanguineus TaxID=34632 RepID=A0A9D4PFW7_RHISA|nr:hypothetical protein HPB52_019254 [Rhipicephalus sanguineus]